MKEIVQYSLNDLAQMEKITVKAWKALITNNPNDEVSYADLCTELGILLFNSSNTLDVPLCDLIKDITSAANKIENLEQKLVKESLRGGDGECD